MTKSIASEDPTISFEEFKELVEEAGISVDDINVLEQDYRAGRALANAVDALISDYENNPTPVPREDALANMDAALTLLDEGSTTEANAAVATKLAVAAIRYLAECCHDEGKN